jgi:hypothetical protein
VLQSILGMNASQFGDPDIKSAYINTVAASMSVSPISITNFHADRRRRLSITLLDSVQIGYTVSVNYTGSDPLSTYSQLISSLNTAMSNPTGTCST